jgi:hypothetical protein
MQVVGCASISADGVLAQLRQAAFDGRPFLASSDGQDVVVVLADRGEPGPEVVALARKVVPDLCE